MTSKGRYRTQLSKVLQTQYFQFRNENCRFNVNSIRIRTLVVRYGKLAEGDPEMTGWHCIGNGRQDVIIN